MTILYETLNPIDRDERNKINENWRLIMLRFSRIQNEINLLSGESSVEDILSELNIAIANANNTVQGLVENNNQSIASVNAKLAEVDSKLIETQNAINNANIATSNANAAIADARQAISDFNNYFNNFKFEGVYNPATTYQRFNFVRYGKSTYSSLKQNLGITPTDNGVDWVLVAEGGIDGTGAVSTVNGVNPNQDGNVVLQASDVGAASENDLETTNTNVANITNNFNSYTASKAKRVNVTKTSMQIISPGTNIITFDSIQNSGGADFATLVSNRVMISQTGMYLVLCNLNKSSLAVTNIEININSQSLATVNKDYIGSYHFSDIITVNSNEYIDVNVYNPDDAIFDISEYATNLTIVRLS